MDAKQFLIERLASIGFVFPGVTLSYAFDLRADQHIVIVEPGPVHRSEEFEIKEFEILSEFYEKFPGEGLLFLAEDSSLKFANAEVICIPQIPDTIWQVATPGLFLGHVSIDPNAAWQFPSFNFNWGYNLTKPIWDMNAYELYSVSHQPLHVPYFDIHNYANWRLRDQRALFVFNSFEVSHSVQPAQVIETVELNFDRLASESEYSLAA